MSCHNRHSPWMVTSQSMNGGDCYRQIQPYREGSPSHSVGDCRTCECMSPPICYCFPPVPVSVGDTLLRSVDQFSGPWRIVRCNWLWTVFLNPCCEFAVPHGVSTCVLGGVVWDLLQWPLYVWEWNVPFLWDSPWWHKWCHTPKIRHGNLCQWLFLIVKGLDVGMWECGNVKFGDQSRVYEVSHSTRVDKRLSSTWEWCRVFRILLYVNF